MRRTGYRAETVAKSYVPTDLDRRIVAQLRRLIGPGRRFRSRYHLCVSAKIDPSSLSKPFTGERGIGIELFVRLRDGLKVSADALLDPVSQAEMDAAIQPGEPTERVVRSQVAAARRHVAAMTKARGKAKKTSA